MSKAEDLALEALDMYAPKGINEQVGLVYTKAAMLGMFKDGYHQAEKDLELSWEDIALVNSIISEMLRECGNDILYNSEKEFCKEVLKRFKDLKK